MVPLRYKIDVKWQNGPITNKTNRLQHWNSNLQFSKSSYKNMSPLSKCKYTRDSTKHFMKNIKQETVHDWHKIVLFDVESLFTNVPQITRPEMNKLLTLCTKKCIFYIR